MSVDPEAIDETDPRYISVKESFNSPSSRILLDLPILPRIVTQSASSFPNLFGGSHPEDTPPTDGHATSELRGKRTTRRVAVAVSGDPAGIPLMVVIVIDRPGMGLSEPWDLELFADKTSYSQLTSVSNPWRGSFLDGAELIIQVADALQLKRFALMGMSCGCVYSLAVALKHPERMLPVPLQLFACWVPPSMPECSLMVKSAFMLPTLAIVPILASAQKMILDPSNAGVMKNLTKVAKWITEFSTSSGAFISSASGALLSTKKNDSESPDEENTAASPVRRDPGGVLLFRIILKLNAITYVLARNPFMSPQEAEREVLRLVGAAPTDDPEFDYRSRRRSASRSPDRRGRSSSTLSRKRSSSSFRTSATTDDAIAASASLDPDNVSTHSGGAYSSPPSPAGTTKRGAPPPARTSSLAAPGHPLRPLEFSASDSALPARPPSVASSRAPFLGGGADAPAPASLDPPPWAPTDVSAELPYLLPFPYSSIGAIDDFLHCIERTGRIGFAFEDIKHPVTARHGAKDTLVPLSTVQAVGRRCGWRVEVYDEDVHDMRKSTLADGFREVREAILGLRMANVDV
ncbi:hypothetical protein HDU96_006313 [Phlyctochytrium bullatum]|nr:hypothetical protein HDU96_006313 [Phlyctochytrium bullatum]